MKEKILIVVSVFLMFLVFVVFVAALGSLINVEHLDFDSKYEAIRTETLMKNKDLYVLYILGPNHSDVEKGPFLKKELDMLKENDIPYYLVADVLYNKKHDENLDKIREELNLKDERIYIMDKGEFPINGGVFHTTERYDSFVKKITGGGVPSGYMMHIIMNKGEIVSFASLLEKDKLPIEI